MCSHLCACKPVWQSLNISCLSQWLSTWNFETRVSHCALNFSTQIAWLSDYLESVCLYTLLPPPSARITDKCLHVYLLGRPWRSRLRSSCLQWAPSQSTNWMSRQHIHVAQNNQIQGKLASVESQCTFRSDLKTQPINFRANGLTAVVEKTHTLWVCHYRARYLRWHLRSFSGGSFGPEAPQHMPIPGPISMST